MFADCPAWFSSEVLETPVRDLPESKKSFLPSVSEKKIVGKMVHAIKMGWMKPTSKVKEDPDDPDKKTFYMLWKTDDQVEGNIYIPISISTSVCPSISFCVPWAKKLALIPAVISQNVTNKG